MQEIASGMTLELTRVIIQVADSGVKPEVTGDITWVVIPDLLTGRSRQLSGYWLSLRIKKV
jgi:hypothetical protein